MGNVVGSNIFNVLFILGISAVIVPLVVAPQLIRIDLPLLILTSFAVYVIALDGKFGRTDGYILSAGLIAYIIGQIFLSRKVTAATASLESKNTAIDLSRRPMVARLIEDLAFIIVGLVILILNARRTRHRGWQCHR